MSNLLVEKLYKKLRPSVYAFLEEAETVDAYAYCSFRTLQEQADLYAQGRTKPGQIVTNAKAGYSWHNYGLAFDVVFKNEKGWTWSSPNWNTLGMLGEKHGLTWGGRWKQLPDRPHFQMTFSPSGLTDSQWMAKLRGLYLKTWRISDVWAYLDKSM